MIAYNFSVTELTFYLLILVRITCFIFIAPFFSYNSMPNRVKIGMGVFIAYLLYSIPSVSHVLPEYHSVLAYTVLVLKEAVIGLLIGFGAQICTLIVTLSGQMIDMNVGLSMVTMMDPASQSQSTVSGVYVQQVTMVIMVVSGLYQYLIRAIADTYTLIPVGTALLKVDHLSLTMITFMGDYILIGFRIALPTFAAIMILNCVLGILAKVAPQLNMFAVGIQLKLLVGLAVMFLTVSMMSGASDFIMDEIRKMVTLMVEGMV